MRKYLIISGALTAVILGVWSFQEYLFWNFHSNFLTVLGFFFVQSLVISFILKTGEKDPASFPIYFIATIGIRFITALFFLLVCYYLGVENMEAFVIEFVALYLLFMIFELSAVLSNLRQNSRPR